MRIRLNLPNPLRDQEFKHPLDRARPELVPRLVVTLPVDPYLKLSTSALRNLRHPVLETLLLLVQAPERALTLSRRRSET